jgi:hypothetical protein
MNFEELPRALGNIIHSITNVINKPLKYTISNTLNAANYTFLRRQREERAEERVVKIAGAGIPEWGARTSRTLRAVTGSMLLLLATGCVPWVGPVELRLETGGVRQDDFVIRPARIYGMIHSDDAEWLAPQVVSSETDLTIPLSWCGVTFSSFRVYVYHPAFVPAFTGESKSGKITLPPVPLESWTSRLASHGVSVTTARMHLKRLRENWIPAFEPGPARARLRRYLTGLEQLVARVTLEQEDLGHWVTIEAARADLNGDLRSLAETMR